MDIPSVKQEGPRAGMILELETSLIAFWWGSPHLCIWNSLARRSNLKQSRAGGKISPTDYPKELRARVIVDGVISKREWIRTEMGDGRWRRDGMGRKRGDGWTTNESCRMATRFSYKSLKACAQSSSGTLPYPQLSVRWIFVSPQIEVIHSCQKVLHGNEVRLLNFPVTIHHMHIHAMTFDPCTLAEL